MRGRKLAGWLTGLSALVSFLVLEVITITGLADAPGSIAVVLLVFGLVLSFITRPVTPQSS